MKCSKCFCVIFLKREKFYFLLGVWLCRGLSLLDNRLYFPFPDRMFVCTSCFVDRKARIVQDAEAGLHQPRARARQEAAGGDHGAAPGLPAGAGAAEGLRQLGQGSAARCVLLCTPALRGDRRDGCKLCPRPAEGVLCPCPTCSPLHAFTAPAVGSYKHLARVSVWNVL